MYKMLRQQSEILKESVVRFAQDLVRVPSVSLNERAIAALVEQQMKKVGYDKVLRDDYGNVIGILFGYDNDRSVLLNSHMDTVPLADPDSWSCNPYEGLIRDGLLYGLGATDCKGGLAAQVYAGALLKRSLLPLRGNVVVAATVAEENGRSVGVRGLMQRTLPELGIQPSYAILGEPTGLGLYYGHDGWLEIEVRVEGTNPFQVEDAAGAIIGELHAANGTALRPEELTVRRPRFVDDNGFRRATIEMNRRLRSDEEVGSVLSQLKHNVSMVAESSGPVAVDVLVREETQRLYNGQTTVVRHITNAWQTDPFHPLIDRTRDALAAAGCAKVHPGKWELGRLGMGTAGGVLTKEFNVPTIGYGPGIEEKAHVQDECVEVAKITEAVYGTTAIIHSLIGVPVFGWTSDEI